MKTQKYDHRAVMSLTGGAIGLAVLAQWVSHQYGGLVFMRDEYQAGAWWQLGTSQWVHLTLVHALVNILGMGLILFAFRPWVSVTTQCIAWGGGHFGVALVIVLDPACSYYAGASGALHGLLAGSTLSLAVRRWSGGSGGINLIAGLVLVGLITKLILQQYLSTPPASDWLGVTAYRPAHAAGALGGLLLIGLFLALKRSMPS